MDACCVRRLLVAYLWLMVTWSSTRANIIVDMHSMGLTDGDLQGSPYDENLTDLILYDNDLTSLGDHVFSGYPYLSILTLSYNDITTVSELAFENTVLKHLDISNNRLTEFPNLSAVATTLQILRLKKNKIATIPSYAFSNMENLNTLEFSYNLLSAFPNLSSLPINGFLRNLHLDNNQMDSASTWSFAPLQMVKVVTMSFNNFMRMPDVRLATQLQQLDMAYNLALYDVPYGFSGLPLRTLELKGCNLTAVPDISSVASSLTYLDLQNNPLQDLNNAQLYGAFLGMTALKTLTFSGTGLTSLPDIRDQVPALTTLKLAGLGLRCDCDLAWLREAQVAGITVDLDPNPCGSPASLIGQPWSNVHLALQSCPGKCQSKSCYTSRILICM